MRRANQQCPGISLLIRPEYSLFSWFHLLSATPQWVWEWDLGSERPASYRPFGWSVLSEGSIYSRGLNYSGAFDMYRPGPCMKCQHTQGGQGRKLFIWTWGWCGFEGQFGGQFNQQKWQWRDDQRKCWIGFGREGIYYMQDYRIVRWPCFSFSLWWTFAMKCMCFVEMTDCL